MTRPAPTKTIKKLTVEIVDEKVLVENFPELVTPQTVTHYTVDRENLYPLVKAYHAIGKQVPGVHAYYASEEQAQPAPQTGAGESEGEGRAS